MTGAAAAPRLTDLRTRAIAGVAMLLVAAIALMAGGFLLWALGAVAALVMLAEWAGLMRCSRGRGLLAMVALTPVLIFLMPSFGVPDRDSVAALVSAALVVTVLTGSSRLGLGLIYAGAPVIAILFLRGEPNGVWLAAWTVAVVVATDTGAYFSGRAIGGPRLAPRVSPSKTWAGLGGGVVAAGLTGFAIAHFAGLPAMLTWLGAPLAVLAQAGDLFESWLKRRAGVKDSGRLLPGHGGVLDRLDGLVPVATTLALVMAAG